MSSNKIRVGIIGTGGIANSHMRCYLNIPEVEIVAAADIVPGKAREYLDRYSLNDAKAYEDTAEMLKKEGLDAVSVCTYNQTHALCSAMAMRAGCHVICEKPMCVTMDQAVEIMRAEQETGKIMTIGFQPRYNENMKKCKKLVADGDLGKVYYVQTGGGRRRGIPGRSFIFKDTAGVGALADIGCYSLDFAMNTIGYPTPLTVSAVSYDYLGKDPSINGAAASMFEVDDFAAAFIRCEGNITVDWRISWAMHMDTTGDTFFLGTKGGLKVKLPPSKSLGSGVMDGGIESMTVYHDYFGDPTATELRGVETRQDVFFLKVRTFIDEVLKGKDGKAPIPTSEIIKNQMIVSGIIESSKLGREVEVKLPVL